MPHRFAISHYQLASVQICSELARPVGARFWTRPWDKVLDLKGTHMYRQYTQHGMESAVTTRERGRVSWGLCMDKSRGQDKSYATLLTGGHVWAKTWEISFSSVNKESSVCVRACTRAAHERKGRNKAPGARTMLMCSRVSMEFSTGVAWSGRGLGEKQLCHVGRLWPWQWKRSQFKLLFHHPLTVWPWVTSRISITFKVWLVTYTSGSWYKGQGRWRLGPESKMG